MAIKRIWHGWATPENAESHWAVLRETIIPGIEVRQIPRYCGFEVLRRDSDSEVEFVTKARANKGRASASVEALSTNAA